MHISVSSNLFTPFLSKAIYHIKRLLKYRKRIFDFVKSYLSVSVSLLGCFAIPFLSFFIVFLHPLAIRIYTSF